MQISLQVPYDPRQLRRTLRFLLRPQLRLTAALAAVIAVLSLGLLALDPTDAWAYAFLLTAVALGFGTGPLVLAISVRQQAPAIRDTSLLTLDDEGVHVSFPLVETRCRWAGLTRIVETPEVWYLMFGKLQAFTVPKDAMAPEQRAEFGAFLAHRQPSPA
ncbi:YcxB family protein [Cryptosporangium minutisporangium]|uniref:YcxB-like C-terminal domain-containing protein n=1 Tax=Cryptosporangium minutisporangium TaxID=113569 RepID=A0ABP6T807_9ACTN